MSVYNPGFKIISSHLVSKEVRFGQVLPQCLYELLRAEDQEIEGNVKVGGLRFLRLSQRNYCQG